jgi:cysteinyl-tRNA synthetase
VDWYNCGPTVYDSSHMGHARLAASTIVPDNAKLIRIQELLDSRYCQADIERLFRLRCELRHECH